MSTRVGVFGGAFDPIHAGHLALARACRDALRLDRVLFLPTGDPPHKRTGTPAEDRIAMVVRAIAHEPAFSLSRVDVDRPGPHYSVDALALLRAQLGPDAELFLLIGADEVAALPRWSRPDEVLAHATVVAVERPGYPPCDRNVLDGVVSGARERIVVVDTDAPALSSTDLRARLAAGAPLDGHVPASVLAYARARGLYGSAVT